MMDIYAQIAQKIIEAQELIIGPVAIDQARLVPGIAIDWQKNHDVSVDGKKAQEAIDELVGQYRDLFGQIAVETAKEAALRYSAQLAPEKLPKSLK